MYASSSRWAADPLGKKPVSVLEELERNMPVSLIAASPVISCSPKDTVDAVRSNREVADFDHIPVRENEDIIGVLNRDTDSSNRLVLEAMRPLRESMIISADSSLVNFVAEADKRLFALVVEGQQITGIVTLSDLQKLAVRPALFLLITLLEMLLAQRIQKIAADDEEWLKRLDKDRRNKVEKRYGRLRSENLVIDKITSTTLEEKIEASLALGAFSEIESARVDLEQIIELRNAVAHAHEFGLDRDRACQTSKRVRLARRYIETLDDVKPSMKGLSSGL
jgi:CBS domain-containing protein